MGRDALKIIGLTGKYCAGKSSIARLLSEKGMVEIDVDALGHSALNESVDQLQQVFSQDIILPDGKVDRSALGKIVFNDEAELRKLESVVHPAMVKAVKRIIEEERSKGTAGVIVNAALLHRMKLDVLCDIICYVTVPHPIRFLRARKRDRATVRSYLRVLRAQKDIHLRSTPPGVAIFRLRNMGSASFIHRQVDDLCISIGI